MMCLLEYSVYLGSGVVCFVLGVLLAFVHVSVGDLHHYRQAKRFLALSCMLNVCVNAPIVWMAYRGMDNTLLDVFYVPMAYYAQVYLMCLSLLSIFHSHMVNAFSRRAFLLPLLFLALAYVACYVSGHGFKMSEASYALFIHGMPSLIVTHILYAATAVCIVVCFVCMVREARSYRRHIENFFSDAQLEDGMWTFRIAYVYVGYVLMTIVGVFFVDSTYHYVFMAFNTLFMVTSTIVMLNLHQTFCRTLSAVTVPTTENEVKDEAESPAEAAVGENRSLQGIVDEWTQRIPQPYMRSGVTLAMVAGEMGVGVNLLSFFINKVYGENFNAWLNRLRIMEVKRILDDDNTIPLAELADRAGFTDASALGKVFKKFVGVTPSAYRNQR